METLPLLSRSEMKMIRGGRVGCSTTNCVICETGNKCKDYDASLPEQGCSWGICEECC